MAEFRQAVITSVAVAIGVFVGGLLLNSVTRSSSKRPVASELPHFKLAADKITDDVRQQSRLEAIRRGESPEKLEFEFWREDMLKHAEIASSALKEIAERSW